MYSQERQPQSQNVSFTNATYLHGLEELSQSARLARLRYEVIPAVARHPDDVFDLIDVAAKRRAENPNVWATLTHSRFFRDVFVPGQGLSESTLENLLTSDTFMPPAEGTPPEAQVVHEAKRLALKAYFGAPLRFLNTPDGRISIRDLHHHMAVCHKPVISVLNRIAQRAQGKSREDFNQLAAYQRWYVTECQYQVQGTPFPMRPEDLAVLGTLKASDEQLTELDAISYASSYASMCVETEVDISTFPKLKGSLVPSQAEQNQRASVFSARSFLDRVDGPILRPKRTIQLPENLLKVIESLSQHSQGRGFVIDEVGVRTNIEEGETSLLSEAISLAAHGFAALYRSQHTEEVATGEIGMQVLPMPERRIGLFHWSNPKGLALSRPAIRDLVTTRIKETTLPLTSGEMATALKYLLGDPPADMSERITQLDDARFSNLYGLHSRGYVDDLSAQAYAPLRELGFEQITFVKSKGGIEAGIQFGGKMLRVQMKPNGTCIFPLGFYDKEASDNVTLIIKSHLVALLEQERPKATLGDDLGTASGEHEEGREVSHRVAHIKVLPYGNQSTHLNDQITNKEVESALGISLDELNFIFTQLQTTHGFDPMHSESYSSSPLFIAQPLSVQRKLAQLIDRMRYKRSSRTSQIKGNTVITPLSIIADEMGRYTKVDGTPVLISVPTQERALGCELAWVSEVTQDALQDIPISVDTSEAVIGYSDIIPANSPNRQSGVVYRNKA